MAITVRVWVNAAVTVGVRGRVKVRVRRKVQSSGTSRSVGKNMFRMKGMITVMVYGHMGRDSWSS